MPRKMKPLAQRFWSKVVAVESGCWEWSGARNPMHHYGHIGLGTRQDAEVHAHRAAWLLTHFIIPDGLHVLHRCDNPPCVNPAHLFLGTPAENSADMVAKGRQNNALKGRRGSQHARSKFTEEDVRSIKRSLSAGATHRELALAYGVDRTTITCISRGTTWSHVPMEGGS